MTTISEQGPRCGTRALCGALDLPVATYYRARQRQKRPADGAVVISRRASPARALQPAERQQVLGVLHAPRFIDLAPAQVYATLLDE